MIISYLINKIKGVYKTYTPLSKFSNKNKRYNYLSLTLDKIINKLIVLSNKLNIKITLSHLRFLGNILIVLGYILIVYVELLQLGLIIRLIGGLLTWPYYLKNHLSDLILVSIAFTIIDLLALLRLLL